MSRRPDAPVAEPDARPDLAAASAQPTIRRRTPLPNGRAVAGGFLVAVAVLGVAGARLGAASPAQPYVVASRALPPGHVLGADDLALAPADLPPELAAGAHHDPAALHGAVTLGPVGPGELVQAGAVVAPAGDGGPVRELAVAVPRARAVDGRLVPGDRVDLLATFGTPPDTTTAVVAGAVPVHAVGDDAGGLAATGELTVTLALADDDELLAAAHASQEGSLVLVRSTGVERPLASTSYRPDGHGDDGEGDRR